MKRAIVFHLDNSYGNEERVVVPFASNIDDEFNQSVHDFEGGETEAFAELKKKWEDKEWGYYAKVTVEKLINVYERSEITSDLSDIPEDQILDNLDEDVCSEFYGLQCFSALMIDPELYSRPFDNSPNGNRYSCQFAVDCDKGEIYSKDFAYSTCDSCDRTICQQNPSNGWMYQFHDYEDIRICNKCFEEQMFEKGLDLDEILRTKQLDGGFFNKADLEKAGFEIADDLDGVMVGSGHSGYSDPKNFFDRLNKKRDELSGKKIILSFESMAIGGMGGYVTVWVK